MLIFQAKTVLLTCPGCKCQATRFVGNLWAGFCRPLPLLLKRLLVFSRFNLGRAGCNVCCLLGCCQFCLVGIIGTIEFFPFGAVFFVPVRLCLGVRFDLCRQLLPLLL